MAVHNDHDRLTQLQEEILRLKKEKDICLLGADFLCCVLFLALSLLL